MKDQGETQEETSTYVIRCADCDRELNRATGVPNSERGRVTISAPLAAGKCKNGCRSTFSDCNLNWKGTWYPGADAPPEPEADQPSENGEP